MRPLDALSVSRAADHARVRRRVAVGLDGARARRGNVGADQVRADLSAATQRVAGGDDRNRAAAAAPRAASGTRLSAASGARRADDAHDAIADHAFAADAARVARAPTVLIRGGVADARGVAAAGQTHVRVAGGRGRRARRGQQHARQKQGEQNGFAHRGGGTRHGKNMCSFFVRPPEGSRGDPDAERS